MANNTEITASKLINWGYRKTSNSHRLVARIDRPDWYRFMAQEHAPWDPNGEGIDWVFKMGPASAGDHYRRVYSRDFKTVTPAILDLMPSSNHDDCGYCRKSNEPKTHDVCRGDIEMTEFEGCPRKFYYGEFKMPRKIDTPTDPFDVQGMYKIHGINTVTGKASCPHNDKFYDDFDEALSRAKQIVRGQPEAQMVILKCTHVVQSIGPPIEVIDLEKMEHSDCE